VNTKKAIGVIATIILLSGLVVTAASAQFTIVTSFQVQNLSSETANVILEFYDENGDVVSAATLNDTILGDSSKLYTQANNADLPSGFNGSVVVSADQPIAAIAVQEAKNPSNELYQGTYSGFSSEQASDEFFIPTVMKAFYGYTTEISVQNASLTNVDVTVNYAGGTSDSHSGLKPGQVVRFDNGSTTGMADGYIGSGIVTATGGEVVAVVNQNNVASRLQQTYEGFSVSGAGTELYAPVLMRAFYGFDTSVQVQNVDPGSTDVTIYYSNGTSKTETLATQGATALFTQGNDAGIPNGWIGSARITSTGGNRIIAVVNQQNDASGKAASYNAVASPGTVFVGPNVMKEFYGFNTSIQVQNIGSSTTCTATFSNGTSQTSATLGQYDSHLFTQQNNADLGASFIGSVEIECGGQPLVAIVNQNGPDGTGDNAMAYNAIGQ
jgi:hypothetical protein